MADANSSSIVSCNAPEVLPALHKRAANCYDLFVAISKVVNGRDGESDFAGLEQTLLVQAFAEKGMRLMGQSINITSGDFDPANIEGVGHE